MDIRIAFPEFKSALQPVIIALRWLWSVFASLLVIVAFALILYFTGAQETWHWLSAKTWQETQCEIQQVYSGRRESTEAGSTSVSITFKVSADYSYRNDYGVYAGNRYDFKGLFRSSYKSVKRDLEYLRSNSRVPCYYNPRNPEQSVINRRFQLDSLIMLLPLLTVGPFAYMAFCSLIRRFGLSLRQTQKKPRFLP